MANFNKFIGDDYNKISQIVRANLAKKIEKSSLHTNAKNRLLSELYNILILTKSMGWKSQYDGVLVENEKELDLKTKG